MDTRIELGLSMPSNARAPAPVGTEWSIQWNSI